MGEAAFLGLGLTCRCSSCVYLFTLSVHSPAHQAYTSTCMYEEPSRQVFKSLRATASVPLLFPFATVMSLILTALTALAKLLVVGLSA